jgi:hypothetical protein
MQSLQQSFEELRQRIRQGRRLSQTGDDPVFYLVFEPEKMLEVKKKLRTWKAKLKLEGWEVHTFSLAAAVHEILQKHDFREDWIEGEAEDPFDFEMINETLADALTADDSLKNRLQEKLESLADCENGILFVTDLEALHPYLRVGSLEQRLQGKFTVPTVILYPGKRTGKSTLSFLGIYPEDGNYRSAHIGG